MSKELHNLTLAAEWTDDYQGKKDYDGDIVSISTRYWPPVGGGMIFDKSRPELGFQDMRHPRGKHTATSSLVIWHGDPDVSNRDSIDLAEKEFEGDTLEEVKSQVEAWAQEQMNRVVNVLRNEFNK